MSDLPAGWRKTELGKLGTWGSGGTPSKSESRYYGGLIPWLRIADLTDDAVSAAEMSISDDGLANSSAKLVPPGTLLVAMYGSIGKLGVTTFPCATNQAIAHCVVDTSSATTRFLLLQLKHLRGHLVGLGQGGSQQNISQGILKCVEVAVPPLPVQRRIVKKLDALLAQSRTAREQLEAVPTLVETYRQSVLAAAFRGDLTAEWRKKNPNVEPASKLLERIRIERRKKWEEAELAKMKDKGTRPKDDKWKAKYVEPEPVDTTDLPQLPETWGWATVGEVAPLQAGYAFPSKGFRSAGVRLLKGNNVRDGWIFEDEVSHWDGGDAAQYSDFQLSQGEIVLAMDRPVYSSGSKAVKVVRLPASWHGSLLLQRVGCFRTVDLAIQDYLWCFLRGDAFRQQLISSQNGTQDGKDLPHVSAGVVDASCIPLPPIAEQRALSSEIDKRMAVIDQVLEAARAVEGLADLERVLLAKAFRGELDLEGTDAELVRLQEAARGSRQKVDGVRER